MAPAAEPEILGTDQNGEPVRVGDFLGDSISVVRVMDRKYVEWVYTPEPTHGLIGTASGFPLSRWLSDEATRARARELGYPKLSGPAEVECDFCARRGFKHKRCTGCGDFSDVSPIDQPPTLGPKSTLPVPEALNACASCKVALRFEQQWQSKKHKCLCAYCYDRKCLQPQREGRAAESGPGITAAPVGDYDEPADAQWASATWES